MILSGNFKADSHVVLGLDVDVKAILHRTQTHRGRLTIDERQLGVEARTHDARELTQAFDDDCMLLLNHKENLASHNSDKQNDDDQHKQRPDKSHV